MLKSRVKSNIGLYAALADLGCGHSKFVGGFSGPLKRFSKQVIGHWLARSTLHFRIKKLRFDKFRYRRRWLGVCD